MARSGPQRPDGALVSRTRGERIEAIRSHRVQVGHFVDIFVRHTVEALHQVLRGLWPDRVRVRIVALVADVIDTDRVAVLDAEAIVDEAGDEVLAEDVGGLAAAKVGVRPLMVMLEGEVGPLEEIGDPADAAL